MGTQGRLTQIYVQIDDSELNVLIIVEMYKKPLVKLDRLRLPEVTTHHFLRNSKFESHVPANRQLLFNFKVS